MLQAQSAISSRISSRSFYRSFSASGQCILHSGAAVTADGAGFARLPAPSAIFPDTLSQPQGMRYIRVDAPIQPIRAITPAMAAMPMTQAWYIAPGERGERGDKGEKGERGEKGEQGENGEPGTLGARGERGERGERGAQGPQGEVGAPGQPGATGTQGLRGAKGERGEKGDKGDPGESGVTSLPSALFQNALRFIVHPGECVPFCPTLYRADEGISLLHPHAIALTKSGVYRIDVQLSVDTAPAQVGLYVSGRALLCAEWITEHARSAIHGAMLLDTRSLPLPAILTLRNTGDHSLLSTPHSDTGSNLLVLIMRLS